MHSIINPNSLEPRFSLSTGGSIQCLSLVANPSFPCLISPFWFRSSQPWSLLFGCRDSDFLLICLWIRPLSHTYCDYSLPLLLLFKSALFTSVFQLFTPLMFPVAFKLKSVAVFSIHWKLETTQISIKNWMDKSCYIQMMECYIVVRM